MIIPEMYYEYTLKGKPKEEIMTEIRGLKQSIGRLKNSIENPTILGLVSMQPSEDTRIKYNREYLKLAKKAYAEAGGIYTMSKAEQKAVDFDANIGSIAKVTFTIGGYFGGYRSYIVELFKGFNSYTVSLRDEVKEPLGLLNDCNGEEFKQRQFKDLLKELYIGEWRRSYSTKRFGYVVHDGTQWELEICSSSIYLTYNYSICLDLFHRSFFYCIQFIWY